MIWLLAAVTLAAPPSAELKALVTGHFTATQTDEEARPAVDAAVDRTARSLPWAFRPFARPMLRRSTAMCPGWHLRLDDAIFALRCDGGGGPEELYVVRLDGSTVHEDGGEDYTVTVRIADGSSLSVTWDGPRGGQTNTWIFSPDGTMRRDHEVYSHHLPEPLRWSYSYRRR